MIHAIRVSNASLMAQNKHLHSALLHMSKASQGEGSTDL